MRQKRQEYVQAMQSHLDELEEVKKLPMMEDEDFANEVKEVYEKNSFILGLDGQKVFIGAVRPKEAYELVKQKFERLKQKLSGQVEQRLTDQISSSAVSPSLQPQEQEVPIEELRKNLWENPGKVASILEKKLIKS
jgi:membrane-associated HD superfamily phosphohydrolase